MTSGLHLRDATIMDMPFQCWIKECHQKISERASAFSLLKLLAVRCLADFSRSMRRLVNVRPEWTTLLASCKYPTKDSRSFFLQHLYLIHFSSRACRRCSFSVGSLSSRLTVSMMIPRKVKQVDGPSRFVTARGMFSIAHMATKRRRLLLHSSVPGAPPVM